MSTEFFSRIKHIGSFLGRDFGKVLAKANSLRKSEGAEAVAAFLRENLGDAAERVESRQLDNYVACRVLLSECLAECGIKGNRPRQALEGIQSLLKLPASHPSLIRDGIARWPDLLVKTEGFLRALLDPQWVPNSNKNVFLPELAALAACWMQLKKPQFAKRVCLLGLGTFAADTGLLLLQAEADASVGDFAECLACLKSVIRAGAGLDSAGKIIAMLEMAQASADPNVPGLASALASEVYFRLGRWDQALAASQRALTALGENLENSSVEALLFTCSRSGKLDEFEKYCQAFLKRDLPADELARLAEETRELLSKYPHRKRLWVVSGAIALRLERAQDAVLAFRQAFVIDRALAPEVVDWYHAAGAYATADCSLCVNLAQVLFRAGQADECLNVLSRLDSIAATPTQLDEAVALSREVVDRLPDHLEARSGLVKLLLRQGDSEGALAAARRMLTLAGAAKAVVDLCVEVAQKAQADTSGALQMPSLQLEVEALLKLPDLSAALDRLETLTRHPDATRDRLLWAAECLKGIAAEAAFRNRAGLILGEAWVRLQCPREAAEQFLLAAAEPAPAESLDRACSGLAQVWAQAAEPQSARAALAAGWLRLGRPAAAREPLFACLEKQQKECHELLELLTSQLGEHPAEPEWLALSLEAALNFGDESGLAAAVERLGRLLERSPSSALSVEASARQLEAKAQSAETKKTAVLLHLRCLGVRGQFDDLSHLAQSILGHHPEWGSDLVEAIESTAARGEPADRAHLCMILGRLLSGGVRANVAKAVKLLAQAAQLDLNAWGETVVAETRKLAFEEKSFAGVILTALRTAIQMEQGGALCGEVLQLLDRLSDEEVLEARILIEAVLKDQSASAQVWLARARCDMRLEQFDDALAAYRRILKLPGEAQVEAALHDLGKLHQEQPENSTVFTAYVDALLRRNEVPAARSELVKRISLFREETADCLQRLGELQKRSDGSWEDLCALAEALRIAGRPEDALRLWNQVLRAPGIDWAKCATGLQQLCIAMPKDFGAGALLVRAEARSLPADKLKTPVRRLERILALPEKSEVFLQSLLEDCAFIEQKAKDREELVRPLAMRRAELRALQRDDAGASAELERLLQRWPADAAAVESFCRLQAAGSGAAIYFQPQARAALMHGDFEAAADALRRLVDALPAQMESARKLCQEFLGQAEGEAWELLQSLRGDLASRAGDYREAAQFYLALADRAPGAASLAKDRLKSLVQQGVDAPEVHLALADLELDGKAEHISAAFCVLREYLARDVAGHFALTLNYLGNLKRRFPECVDARIHVIWTLVRRPEAGFAPLETEAAELFRDFGPVGATAFIEFCSRDLAASLEHIPLWHLKCTAHELLGDLPGSLECLRTLAKLDFAGQVEPVKRRAEAYRKPGRGPAAVVALLADLAQELQRHGDALECLAEAVELPEADLVHVRDGLKSILKAQPANGVALCALARCEWKAGNPAAATRYFHLAARQPDAPPLGDRLKELCVVFPESAKCWFVRAQYSHQHGDAEDAFACLQRICPGPGLEREEQILAWKMLAECYARQQKFDEAVRIVRKVVETDPEDDEAACRLIRLYFEKNARRLSRVTEELERGGATPELIMEHAGVLQALGDYAGAVRAYRKVPRIHPLAGAGLVESGKCHLALNECHLAAVAFKSVLILGPTTELRREALYHLGLAHARRLEFENAVRVFEELCVEDPGYRDAAEQLRRNFEQLQAGAVLRVAEVPFDLLAAWKQVASDTQTDSAAAASAPPAPSQV